MLLALAACNAGLPGMTVDPNTVDYQSYTVVKRRISLPKGTVIRDCGPEALSAVFRYLGKKTSVDEVSNEIYSPQLKATLVSKVLAYCHDAGFRAVPKRGSIADLRSSVQENRPVIIMVRLNANLSHFFVVAGYSDKERKVLCPYYDDQVLLVGYPDLLYLWEAADFFLLELATIDDPFERAERSEQGRRFPEAIPLYEQALAADKENYRAWVGLGNCYAQTNKPLKARDAYRQALAIYPHDPQLLNNLADCLVTLGENKPEALDLAKQAVSLYEQIAANLQRLLKEPSSELERQDQEAQLEQTAKCLGFSYGTLGQAFFANDLFDKSREAFERSYQLIPPLYKSSRIKRLYEIAECYRRLKNVAKADEYQQKADQLKSGQ